MHRSRTLTPDDVTRDPVHGLPVTTVARTLSDMSRALTPHRLTRLCHRAEHLQNPRRLPNPAPPKLRRALDSLAATGPQMTRSELEERFLAIAAGAGLPPPSSCPGDLRGGHRRPPPQYDRGNPSECSAT